MGVYAGLGALGDDFIPLHLNHFVNLTYLLNVLNEYICPKCDNKGVVNNRRCSKCKGFGYLADQRIYPLKYAGSFSTGEQRSMNRESAWPVRRFGVRDNLSLPTSETLRELASRAKL